MGVSPRPFLVALMLAASASFVTPIGYQTNMMVYGPGGYRFTDYARMGWVFTVLVVVATVALVPTIWPS
jgi:di/tricarboxylate transporter